jgi:hypothetical protein
MQRRVVVMALIPGGIRRPPKMRSDLGYAKYARATWEWWCRRHEADFVTIEAPPEDADYALMPPTFQRWVVVERLLRERGEGAQVLLVDADTMIRWDAPDIFGQANGFSAVADAGAPAWIVASTRAFQHLFPDVSLPWWEYFNSGIIMLGSGQHKLIRTFLDHAVTQWPQLDKVMISGNFGTDQTPFNFIVRQANEPIHFLPRPFNLINCFPMTWALSVIAQAPNPDSALFAEKAFSRPRAFDFVEFGYIWHFTNVVELRSPIMGETWRRIRHNYPGALLNDDE